MRYPMFHGTHWNAINLIPKLNFFINKVFVPYKGTFKFYFGWKDDRFLDIFQMKISSLYHSIQETIIYHVISHWLSNNHFNIFIELSKEEDFDDVIESIFLYYLLHHKLIFSLNFSMAIDNTIDILGTRPSSVNRIKTIAACSKVKDRLAINLVSIALDCLEIGCAGGSIREGGLKALEAKVIDFGEGLAGYFLFVQTIAHCGQNYYYEIKY